MSVNACIEESKLFSNIHSTCNILHFLTHEHVSIEELIVCTFLCSSHPDCSTQLCNMFLTLVLVWRLGFSLVYITGCIL